MAGIAEKINKKDLKRFADLRKQGSKDFDHCITSKIKDMPILEQVASLADTGRLPLFYEAVGKARLEGHSWKLISGVATGKFEYKDGTNMSINYLSFCKNNKITPVKIRGTKNK